MASREQRVAAARIVQDAGGELVGRTRLQKIAFLMQLAGFGETFNFEYHHYGPYSEELSQSIEIASVLGPVVERERVADWGGKYSIYSIQEPVAAPDSQREVFVQWAKKLGAIELELAATAAYLFQIEGIGSVSQGNPWIETRQRKPSKAAGGRLERAVEAYEELRNLAVPRALPALPSLTS